MCQIAYVIIMSFKVGERLLKKRKTLPTIGGPSVELGNIQGSGGGVLATSGQCQKMLKHA